MYPLARAHRAGVGLRRAFIVVVVVADVVAVLILVVVVAIVLVVVLPPQHGGFACEKLGGVRCGVEVESGDGWAGVSSPLTGLSSDPLSLLRCEEGGVLQVMHVVSRSRCNGVDPPDVASDKGLRSHVVAVWAIM